MAEEWNKDQRERTDKIMQKNSVLCTLESFCAVVYLHNSSIQGNNYEPTQHRQQRLLHFLGARNL